MPNASFSVAALLLSASLASPVWAQFNCVDDVLPVSIERARLDHALSYDSVRRVIVMVGGSSDYENAPRETWEFDGTRWRFKAFTPFSGRLKAGMAFDAARNQTVLFGGADTVDPLPGTAYTHRSDTWAWNGTTWTQLASAGPAGRSDMSMAYDGQRQRIVLFGGTDNVGVMGDTWEWNGSAWSLRATNGPAADIGTRMVYDSSRHLCVLVGGSQSFGTTWEWNGVTWIDHPTLTNIGGRHTHSLCFDSVRNKVVLYGGQNTFVGYAFEDTWEYDGLDWTLRADQSTPGVRRDSPMAFHAGIGRTVMFAGANSSDYHTDGKTWLYNGNSWTLLPESGDFGQPGERVGASAVQVSFGSGAQVMLFGGSTSAGLSNETWSYIDQYGWLPISTEPAATPPARRLAGLGTGYGPNSSNTMLFGGGGNGAILNDTWEFDPVTLWTRRDIPGPSARFGHAMTVAGAPFVVRTPIVFGGYDGQQYLNDLWRFEEPTTGGRGWYRLFPADGISPPARFQGALVANDTTSKIILFGGTNGAALFGDTWEFDLITEKWTNIPVSGPAPRQGHTLTYEPQRGTVVLIGGTNGTVLDDVWSFDGFQWTPAQAHVAPRFGHVAFPRPSIEGQILVFGGQAANSVVRGDMQALAFNQRPVIYTQPLPQIAPETSAASFSIAATLATTYQWKKDNIALTNIDGRIIGADSPQLVIAVIVPADAGLYECVVTNECGATISYAAPLDIAVDSDLDGIFDHLDNCPGTENADQADADGDGVGDLCDGTFCPADINGDGSLDPDDLADYISAFFSVPPGPGSDFSGDGTTDPDDLADYISAFFSGCP